jgi:hypothetical protein
MPGIQDEKWSGTAVQGGEDATFSPGRQGVDDPVLRSLRPLRPDKVRGERFKKWLVVPETKRGMGPNDVGADSLMRGREPMMKNFSLFFLVSSLSLFWSGLAEGSDSNREPSSISCRTIAEIDKSAGSCEDNEAFAEAAVLCLRELQALVDKETENAEAALRSSTEAHTADAVRSQTNALGGSAANYNLSADALDRLLRVAREASKSVASYITNIYVPEEIAYVEAGMDLDEILLSSPCYKENHEVLIWVEDDVYQIIDDLEEAKKASRKLDSSAKGRKVRQNTVAPKTKIDRRARGASRAAPGVKVQRSSDISGTEDKKE